MILACHNISKSFGDQVIVKDGSFHIEDREKAALVGVNGAGKSTLLKMIIGELWAISLSIRIFPVARRFTKKWNLQKKKFLH